MSNMHERVLSDPVRGYYLAAYACPVGELGREYVGYYKIFMSKVEDYFRDEPCVVKGVADEVVGNPAVALQLALQAALEQVGNLPHASDIVTLEHRCLQKVAC